MKQKGGVVCLGKCPHSFEYIFCYIKRNQTSHTTTLPPFYFTGKKHAWKYHLFCSVSNICHLVPKVPYFHWPRGQSVCFFLLVSLRSGFFAEVKLEL